jgi:HEAT repeat protein
VCIQETSVTASHTQLAAALALLNDMRSPKRRSGAKQLRKLKDPAAGPVLLTALQKEVQDRRTWETQYHMIMALGECQYTPALPYLQSLVQQWFEATMIYTALGDAIVRLGRAHEHDTAPALALLLTHNDMLIAGALRAVAMLRLKPSQAEAEQIIQYALNQSPYDQVQFWVAAAGPGWHGALVEQFLAGAVSSYSDNTRRAALAAQQKQYLKWSPL